MIGENLPVQPPDARWQSDAPLAVAPQHDRARKRPLDLRDGGPERLEKSGKHGRLDRPMLTERIPELGLDAAQGRPFGKTVHDVCQERQWRERPVNRSALCWFPPCSALGCNAKSE